MTANLVRSICMISALYHPHCLDNESGINCTEAPWGVWGFWDMYTFADDRPQYGRYGANWDEFGCPPSTLLRFTGHAFQWPMCERRA